MSWAIRNILVVVFIFLVVPGSLLAKDYQDKAVITYKGQEGYFFSIEIGDRMLVDLSAFKKLRTEKIPELEVKIRWLYHNVELHKQQVKYLENIAAKTEEALHGSEELRIQETSLLREQLNSKLSWYQKPATIFIIGFVVGSALVVGLSFGLQEAR